MRLDMTLRRKQFAHPDVEARNIKIPTEGGEEVIFRPLRPTVIIEEVGSWVDANQIHNWFVKNALGGKNEQGDYIVTRKQLSKLLDDVRTVIKRSRLIPGKVSDGQKRGRNGSGDESFGGDVIADITAARKILPNIGRFGSKERSYDSKYLYELHETISILMEALDALPDSYYSYSVSW